MTLLSLFYLFAYLLRNSNLILGVTVCAILQTSASKSPSFSRIKSTFLLLLFPKNENRRFVSRSSSIRYLHTPKHVVSLYRLLHFVLFILLYRFSSLDACSSLSFTVDFIRLSAYAPRLLHFFVTRSSPSHEFSPFLSIYHHHHHSVLASAPPNIVVPLNRRFYLVTSVTAIFPIFDLLSFNRWTAICCYSWTRFVDNLRLPPS